MLRIAQRARISRSDLLNAIRMRPSSFAWLQQQAGNDRIAQLGLSRICQYRYDVAARVEDLLRQAERALLRDGAGGEETG